jgi:group II intron reverse transcriptase/maturase
MRNAETVLGLIQDRGRRALPLQDLYRQLYNPDLYLMAYGRIYRNAGAMTPGVTDETVDGMSMAKIEKIIDAVRREEYRWSPVRRVYIEKKGSKKMRPLGIPSWSDKLLQEVIRLLLEAYYEPQFNPASHGFRPKRGCHTALREIYHKWPGTKWFIEGDIARCFDTLDHPIMVSILREKIHDNRIVRLIENLLRAGYLEDWRYNATQSGSPQGAVLSPILSNIYLDKLDRFVTENMLPRYNRGKLRKSNPVWDRLARRSRRLRRSGHKEEAKQLRRQMQQLPTKDQDDPDFRRLRYIRYADDWLLGFIGPRKEAEEIKNDIARFLRDQLKLELSETKTLITPALTGAARFLGYEVTGYHNNQKRDRRGYRCINGRIGLKVPMEAVKAKCTRYLQGGIARYRPELIYDSVFSIVARYQDEYRGTAEYYRLAYNLHQLSRLQWIMERSLTHTLARKLRISVGAVYRRYRKMVQTANGPRRVLQITVEREGKRPLVAQWGNISLARNMKAVLNDAPPTICSPRTELEQRLLANRCELCGSVENIQVHHVRALKDLKVKGRADKPHWVQMMAARQRKTLVTCKLCHEDIHAGRPLRSIPVGQVDTGEPGTPKGVRPVRGGAVGKVPVG